MHLAEGFAASVPAFAHLDAVTGNGRRFTFAEIDERAGALSGALFKLGVRQGDRIAICARNHPDFLPIMLAAFRLGAVVATVNFRLTEKERARALQELEPIALFVSHEAAGGSQLVLDRGGNASTSVDVLCGEAWPAVDVSGEESDLALLIPTSGTTNRPKYVEMTHRVVSEGFAECLQMGLRAGERHLLLAPLFHSVIIRLIWNSLLGVTTVLLDGFSSAEELLGVAVGERVTSMSLPPSVVRWVLEAEDRTEVPHLRFVLSGGAPLMSDDLRRFMERYSCSVYVSGGMTECSNISGAMVSDPSSPLLRTAGFPVANVRMRIVDLDGNEVSPGATGELELAGPKCTPGDWRNSEATSQLKTRDGWIRSGDLVRLNEDGALVYAGRLKDVIITGSENVLAPEVESVLLSTEGVRDAGVAGLPDPHWGEVVAAAVVAEDGVEVERLREQIYARLGEELARYKHPSFLEFVAAVPRSAAGKILRGEVAKLLEDRYTRSL